MRRLVPLATLAVALCLSAPIKAQEVELATYTAEQLWERSAVLSAVGSVAAIGFAKSQGVSPEAYGGYLAELFAPGWGEPGTGTLNIVRGMARNMTADPQCKAEIVEQSASSITMRINRCWVRFFGEYGEWYGVTLEEYDTVWEVFTSGLAEYLGLGYGQRVEGDSSYLTFTLGG